MDWEKIHGFLSWNFLHLRVAATEKQRVCLDVVSVERTVKMAQVVFIY